MASPVLAFLDIGGPELLLIFILVLVLFGGKRLPEFARGLGRSIREFKKATSGVEEEIRRAMEEPPPKPKSLPPAPSQAALPAGSSEHADYHDPHADPYHDQTYHHEHDATASQGYHHEDPVAAVENIAPVPPPSGPAPTTETPPSIMTTAGPEAPLAHTPPPPPPPATPGPPADPTPPAAPPPPGPRPA